MLQKPQQKNQFRIIAGRWRGRKLHFADGTDARPTSDRVRETLFNWLSPMIEGATCLDLFAGSGALGLEALSRGAKQVTFVDSNRHLIKSLEHNLALLLSPSGDSVKTPDQSLRGTEGAAAISANQLLRDGRATLANTNREFSHSLDGQVYCQKAADWLVETKQTFDAVFLDPPFQAHQLPKLCKLLSDNNIVNAGGRCYMEMSVDQPPFELPSGWQVLRDKQAGRVRYQLIEVNLSA